MAAKKELAVVDLIVDGKSAQTSIGQVGQALKAVNKELRDLKEAEDPAKYKALIKEKKILREEYVKQKTAISDLRTGWEKFKANLGNIAPAVIGANLLTSALSKAGETVIKLINRSGELGDELAEVQKQTGLAGKDLQELNGQLMGINTRTPADELRKLAAVAGKLGYQTKEDVLSFVKVADMLNVTLAEDLGGNIEESVNDIGKLIEVFGVKEEFGLETSMLKTASAINTIGASSAANEGYLVNWSKRFAGIAPNAGISISDTLGIAATMDILGQSAELSSTNIAKIIVAIGKDMPYFAKVAGMQLQEFTNLMQTDANEGFIRVLEGAKGSSKGLEGMVKTLETLGIEGSEGAQILGALSKNTTLLREQQDISNKSFTEGTSIINEFNVANNTTGAILEKISNKMAQWFDNAASYLDPVIIKFGQWMGVVNKLDLELDGLKSQQSQLIQMESKLPKLIARYDELAQKTNRSKEEQKELTDVTRAIAKAVPEAAFEFDKYGNALQVSTEAAMEFIKQNRIVFEQMRQQKQEMASAELAGLNGRAELIRNDLNRGKTRKLRATSMQGYVYDDVPLTGEEIQQMQGELAEIQANIRARRQDLQQLNGIDDIETRRRRRNGQPEPGAAPAPGQTPAPGAASTPGKPAGQAATSTDSQIQEMERLEAELHKIRQQMTLDAMSEDRKQIESVHLKYEAFREKAKGNKELLAEINQLEADEIGKIQAEANAKQMSEFDAMMRGKLQSMADTEAKRIEFQTKISDMEEERRNAELFKIKEHYQALIAEAEMLGMNTTGLYVLWAADYNSKKAEQAVLEIAKEQETKRTLSDTARQGLEDELRMIDDKRNAYQNIASAIGNVFEILAGNQAEYTNFQKAIALVQLGIDSASAIASAVRVGASGSVTPIDLFIKIAATVASVTSNILSAKKILSKQETPSPPKFAEGGYTNLSRIAEGFTSQPTLYQMPGREFIAGEAGTEFILSNKSLQVPAVANFARMMDAAQRSGNLRGLQSAVDGAGSGNDVALVSGLNRVYAGIEALREDVRHSSARPLVFSHNQFDDSRDFRLQAIADTQV